MTSIASGLSPDGPPIADPSTPSPDPVAERSDVTDDRAADADPSTPMPDPVADRSDVTDDRAADADPSTPMPDPVAGRSDVTDDRVADAEASTPSPGPGAGRSDVTDDRAADADPSTPMPDPVAGRSDVTDDRVADAEASTPSPGAVPDRPAADAGVSVPRSVLSGGEAPAPRASAWPLRARGGDRRRAPAAGLMEVRRAALVAAEHRAEYRRPWIWLWRRTVGAAFAFVAVVSTWWLVTLPDGLVDARVLPAPERVAATAVELAEQPLAGADLWGHAGTSLLRLGFGLGFGVLAGALVGLAMASSPHLRTVIDPVVSVLRMVPSVVAAPLLLIWFGVDEMVLVAVIAHGIAWSVADLVGAFRVGRMRRPGPDPVDRLAGSIRSILLTAWTTVLAVEVVAAPVGIGSLVWFGRDRPAVVLVGVLAAGLVGAGLDVVVRGIHYAIATHRAATAPVSLGLRTLASTTFETGG